MTGGRGLTPTIAFYPRRPFPRTPPAGVARARSGYHHRHCIDGRNSHQVTGLRGRAVTTDANTLCPSSPFKGNPTESARAKTRSMKVMPHNLPGQGKPVPPIIGHSPAPPDPGCSGAAARPGPPRPGSPRRGRSLTASPASCAGRPERRARGSRPPTPGTDPSCRPPAAWSPARLRPAGPSGSPAPGSAERRRPGT